MITKFKVHVYIPFDSIYEIEFLPEQDLWIVNGSQFHNVTLTHEEFKRIFAEGTIKVNEIE